MAEQELEKTLIILKPDTIQRGLVGEIITRFEKVGLKIVATKMISPDKEHYYYHYEDIGQMVTRRGKETFDITLDMMLQGPVIAIVLEGIEAVALVRKMIGATEPKSAAPGTIRGDYSHMSFGYADNVKKGIPNLIHASGSSEEADKEISHWFKSEELFGYQTLNEKFTR